MASMAATSSNESYNGHLIVFDFDCTLTTKHYYYFMNKNNINHQTKLPILDTKITDTIDDLDKFRNHIRNNETSLVEKQIIIDQFFGGDSRFQKLKDVLQTLKDRGCHIIIASRGKKEEIIALLKCVGMLDLFNEIYGQPTSKTFLLFNKMNRIECKYLYYFDDDRTENDTLINDFREDKALKKENMENNFEVSIITILTSNLSHNVEYNFFNKLEKNGNGLTIEYLDNLLIIINDSIQRGKISNIEIEVPYDGTEYFNGDISKASTYYKTDYYYEPTAIKNNDDGKWYQNSKSKPTVFRLIKTPTHKLQNIESAPRFNTENPEFAFKKYLKYKQKYLKLLK